MENKVKYLAFVLTLAVLFPSVIKLGHLFENHKHEACTNHQTTHIHTLDLDCKFYKFKLNNSFSVSFFNYHLIKIKNNFTHSQAFYQFLNRYQGNGFVLRGPPILI